MSRSLVRLFSFQFFGRKAHLGQSAAAYAYSANYGVRSRVPTVRYLECDGIPFRIGSFSKSWNPISCAITREADILASNFPIEVSLDEFPRNTDSFRNYSDLSFIFAPERDAFSEGVSLRVRSHERKVQGNQVAQKPKPLLRPSI